MAPAAGGVRRVLIAGINYRPEVSGIAPYTTGIAEHLAATGRRVTVLTGMPHYPRWRVADGYGGRPRVRERINGVEVIRLAHYVPSRQSALLRGLYEATFFLHGLRGLALPRPDAVLGIVPALSGGVLARVIARGFRVPYGLLFQDLIGPAARQSGTPNGDRVGGLVRASEAWAARGASVVAAVATGFFPYLRGLGVAGERLVHLPNWTHVALPVADRVATRRALGWAEAEQVVLHAGNMGVKQALEQVLDAARLAAVRGLPMRFVFLGDGSQRRALELRARDRPNCTFLAPVPEESFSAILAAADVLLVSERTTMRDMSLPSKLTSYFAAGRPVVAAVFPAGCTARELHRSGGGLVTPAGDPEALLGALEQLRNKPALAERLGNSGRTYARDQLGAAAALARSERFIERIRPAAREVAT